MCTSSAHKRYQISNSSVSDSIFNDRADMAGTESVFQEASNKDFLKDSPQFVIEENATYLLMSKVFISPRTS